jgi:hypothetical protein
MDGFEEVAQWINFKEKLGKMEPGEIEFGKME